MPESDIRRIVSKANDRWNAAFNSGDAAAVAALYTADGTVLPHTHAVVKGTAAIADFWAGLISAGVKDHGIELLDAQERATSPIPTANGGRPVWETTARHSVLRGQSSRFCGSKAMVPGKPACIHGTEAGWLRCASKVICPFRQDQVGDFRRRNIFRRPAGASSCGRGKSLRGGVPLSVWETDDLATLKCQRRSNSRPA